MTAPTRRIALVLSGGGARGAYEAGVLSHVFEHVYPRLGPGFEFHVLSGTSVGAVHAAYTAASAHLDGPARGRHLADTWQQMVLKDMLQLGVSDLVGVPLRALGITRVAGGARRRAGTDVLGGLVDIAPLERVVHERVPWENLRANLDGRRPTTLCVSTTEIRTGRVTVFMDGALANAEPWSYDPNAQAVVTQITESHVRASAAIPFLFPAVRIGDRYYVDGGLRMNTPLSPALRLGCDRILVVALRHPRPIPADAPIYAEEVIAQPAFLLGKVLTALMLDQLEYELGRIGLVNALLEHGREVYGDAFLARINVAVRAHRGADFRPVRTAVVRPSDDVGRIAARCYREKSDLGFLATLLTRVALWGVPEHEADLLSYLLFDRCFTSELIELGRADAKAMEDEIVALMTN